MVKLQSLAIKSAAAEGRAPRRVKLFINRASLGFSEAADFAPVQVRRRAYLLPLTGPEPLKHHSTAQDCAPVAMSTRESSSDDVTLFH